MPHPPRQSDADACPGALRLHAAADGPLARVRLPGGMLTGAQLATLAAVAQECGDGVLELTSRANVQLRGLTGADPATLAARLSAAGLLPSQTHETVRNIAAPPLADATLRAVVHDLDRGLCADPSLAALPGRFLFAVGPVALAADVAAIPAGDTFALLLAGTDQGLRVTAAGVVAGLLAVAHAFLDERAAQAGPAQTRLSSASEGSAWRLSELVDGPARVAARLSLPASPAPHDIWGGGGDLGAKPIGIGAEPVGIGAEPVGIVAQADGLAAVGALVPLGRLTGVHVKVLQAAERLVITPGRGVVVPDLSPSAAVEWLGRLAAAGLAVEGDSPWVGVTACAGRPGCAKSLADVRADAAAAIRVSAGQVSAGQVSAGQVAAGQVAAGGSAGGRPVHWVGCARGCGSPAGAHVRVEATADGYRVDAGAPTRGEVMVFGEALAVHVVTARSRV